MLPNFMDLSLTFCPSCNGNDCDGADEDKNDGDGNDADSSINGEGGDNEYIDTKHSDRDDGDYKHDIGFEDGDGVKGEFLQFNLVSISTVFDANLSFSGSITCT